MSNKNHLPMMFEPILHLEFFCCDSLGIENFPEKNGKILLDISKSIENERTSGKWLTFVAYPFSIHSKTPENGLCQIL